MTATSAGAPAADDDVPAPTPVRSGRRYRLLGRADLLAALLFAALALAFVGPSLLPGRALLPIDALAGYPPWQAHAENLGIALPHNPLIADAILQNYSWKRLARESFAAGEAPLWNPYILAGQPFMASGQNGSLYPLGILFYVLPLAQAYGWFIALHLWIGAAGAYALARTLGAGRVGGVIAGSTFGFCGYLIVSFLWPMVVSTAVWLPALLALIEGAALIGGWHRHRLAAGLIAAGGAVVGLQFLAGHLEMSLYLLLTGGLYTAIRLAGCVLGAGRAWLAEVRRALASGLIALAMVALGTGLAAAQLVPFSEVIGANVRSGWSDYDETIGYALPPARLLAYLLPDLFGNPTHHGYYDVFAGEPRSTEHVRLNGERRTDTEWGGKNYVEGTVYVGVLPVLLAVVALLRRPRGGALTLAVVGVLALALAFGTPLYALLFYGIPGVNQLHTPFRWVYPLSLVVAVLAGLGASRLAGPHPPAPEAGPHPPAPEAGPHPSAPSPANRRGGARLQHPCHPEPVRCAQGELREPAHPPCHPERSEPASAVEGSHRPDVCPPGDSSSRQPPFLPRSGAADGDERRDTRRGRTGGRSARAGWFVGLLAVAVGAVGLVGLAAALALPDQATALAARALRRWPELRDGFGSAEMLRSYQWLNLARAAVLLTAAGACVILLSSRRRRLGALLAVGLLVTDLFSFGIGFNAISDTKTLDFVPPSIQSVRDDPGLFRVVTYGGDDTLPSNTNMLFGLQDVRGYDTIILREYVEYLESIEPQRGIPYSKVAKLFDQRSLSSPLLDALNVKYAFTSEIVNRPGWTLHFQGDGIRVYRNERVLPRAFVLTDRLEAPDRAAALAAVRDPRFDPGRTVVVERGAGRATASSGAAPGATPSGTVPAAAPDHPPDALAPAEVIAYGHNRVTVRATAPASGGVLVLADVYFPGWTAQLDGAPATVLRANALVRAVELPPGEHLVEFAYRPLSFRIGLLLSGLAGAVLVGLVLVSRAAPGRQVAAPLSAAQRVARNSAFPLAASLFNKAVDLGFAIVLFRVLGAEGVGAYTFAGVLVTYFDIVVGWGLATLITRDVAREPEAAGRYFGNSAALRIALWLGAVGLTALLVGPLAPSLGIGPTLALAIWLLAIGLLPSLLSGVISALFQAHERMDLPAVVTVLTTILKVVLGLLALLAGLGYVGLAAVSIVTNLVTLLVLAVAYGLTIGWRRPSVDPRLVWMLAATSLPLMLNGLLNQLFFKIDVLLLKPLAGDLALGWYSTAYKLIDGLQVIPSSFVLALFPLLARHAHSDRRQFRTLTETGLEVLLLLALPIAAGTTVLADWIILVLAGSDYLPEAAHALRVLIWYLPIGFANGLLQYVLIAADRRRTITVAFVVGVAFNLAANLLLIPRYGYLAAAVVTVLSEIVLLVPFLAVAVRETGGLAIVRVAWRALAAAGVMAGAILAVSPWSPVLGAIVGAAVYLGSLVALGALGPKRRAELRALLRRS